MTISNRAPSIDSILRDASRDNLLPPARASVAVAMSGGVDSSVAAALLKELGYAVTGITAWLMSGSGKCCEGGLVDAAKVCDKLAIEYSAEDLREKFASSIVSPFLESYSSGRTPVPCMPCNTEVKWGSLLNGVRGSGQAYLASGHYARLRWQDGRYAIGRARDTSKDQSYMLWGLSQEQLAATAFPLANLEKHQVRVLAEELGLGVWDKSDSMDLCFVPGNNKDYLLTKLGERPGDIVNVETGDKVGTHQGTHLFTVGQRKGIGIGAKQPLYVVELDARNNVVYVGSKKHLYVDGLVAEHANWQLRIPEQATMAWLKTRYNSPAERGTVQICGSGSLEARFQEPQAGVAPGQAIVAYDEAGSVMGGGWILGASPR